MGKLLLESLAKKVKTRKITKAVYKVLGQKAYLKAELVFQDSMGIHDLNRITRGVDSVTDVLSYPSLDGIRGKILFPEDCVTELEGKYIFIGSIVLCEEKIRSQAKEYGNTYEQEREYLIIHGLLHLMGYDHMTDEDKKEMRALEKQILSVLHDKKGKTK
jgi:probable rRNA maturation factor